MMEPAETTQRASGHTPLMRQYFRIKERHPGAILLFRMGDFYETFDTDAVKVSQLLGITLTRRSNGKAADVPLAGFPHHALDTYLPRLVRAGERVAICEQLEDPSKTKKIVKRDVIEVVTPGVSFRDQLLEPNQSNYLASVCWSRRKDTSDVGFAFVDISTGEFGVTEVPAEQLSEMIESISPSEILVEKSFRGSIEMARNTEALVTTVEDWVLSFDYAHEVLVEHFGTHSLKGFGVDDLELGIRAAGAALHYLGETQKGAVPHIRNLSRYSSQDFMLLDPQTRRNLELVVSMYGSGSEGSLIGILDRTQTSMGARLLRKWILRPLTDVSHITERLDAVDALYDREKVRSGLHSELGSVGDLERLAVRVSTGRASPRELSEVAHTLARIPAVTSLLNDVSNDAVAKICDSLDPCNDLAEHIGEVLADDLPASAADGGVIRVGHNAELDELREMARSSKEWLARLQAREANRTGITSLKIGFNRVFGYYLEVTNTHKDKVPDDYIRKQTLVNAERYITPELKEYEEKILTAEERTLALETELFSELRSHVAGRTEVLQRNAQLLARLDCLFSLAEVARQNQYAKPEIDDSLALDICEGRHPVVEQLLPLGEPFIPNDTFADPSTEQILVITGPNMAGKSVALRQVGLIVLMAQVGSFVPAKSAKIGVVDRIFTRVGASDNLAAGESTFLVEMNETANILNNATRRSLILLDEVGRGTSTFDGLSIAWALVEYLHENARVAARTLFATHYHELNELAEKLDRVRNYRVQVKEHDGKVIFLRKLVAGGADHSYGIEVARMAGLPTELIRRARSILHTLESQHLRPGTKVELGGTGVPGSRDQDEDSRSESDRRSAAIADEVRSVDLDRMTPVEALMKLAELRDRARQS
jgi:DNA mismatch repair protein MutS